MPEEETPHSLQRIIGIEEGKHMISVLKNPDKKSLDIYHGFVFWDSCPDDKEHPKFKFLVGSLYTAKVKLKFITKEFGISGNTVRKWAKAINSRDPEEITKAFKGRGANSKMTDEIRAFIEYSFTTVYKRNKYSYSKEIIDDVKDVFKVSFSSETLRPIFNELKVKFNTEKLLKKN